MSSSASAGQDSVASADSLLLVLRNSIGINICPAASGEEKKRREKNAALCKALQAVHQSKTFKLLSACAQKVIAKNFNPSLG